MQETIIYYLQSEVLNTASGAVFSTASNASQIQIADGQLVQNALGTLLYATPEARANSTVTKLAVSWSTEPATGVTFFLTSDYVTMGIQISGIENPVSTAITLIVRGLISWVHAFRGSCSVRQQRAITIISSSIWRTTLPQQVALMRPFSYTSVVLLYEDV
ncbi:hypothetical protein HYPSUDRAFT_919762 [Hypholoma sublateritium FD-334 SS-4]|uniref:Uncharacterized protein n=1 Tax=Hypholoma sublateritium (strain FD-334 SS-4) TaxID=945553 RepID=A0A0D2NID4_HYPSF|nr:hypothetical protein HYPSUDRAFT_919762 [Hypholoma sublateritium FD-334 SS-4]